MSGALAAFRSAFEGSAVCFREQREREMRSARHSLQGEQNVIVKARQLVSLKSAKRPWKGSRTAAGEPAKAANAPGGTTSTSTGPFEITALRYPQGLVSLAKPVPLRLRCSKMAIEQRE
jgi:hypothetical protein